MSETRNASEFWEVAGASAAYFSFLEENVETVRLILGDSVQAITPEELISASEQTEEHISRVNALVALVTKAFVLGGSLYKETDEFKVKEPSDVEIFGEEQ